MRDARRSSREDNRRETSLYLELNTGITDEQRAIRDVVHQFAKKRLRPVSMQLDALDADQVIAAASPLWEVFAEWYSQGNHLTFISEDAGGIGAGPVEQHIVYEELGWGAVDIGISLAVSAFPFTYAARYGTLLDRPSLHEEILAPFLEDREGKVRGCWAITEPAHGSDTLGSGLSSFRRRDAAGSCRAVKDGGDWVINGQKSSWVSNGTIATHACLFCTIDPDNGMAGGGVVLMPLDLPGVSRGKPWQKIGQRGLPQGEIFFDDVRIPERYMIVDGDRYEATVEATIAGANAGMGALFTGVARAALEEAIAYSRERVQGGKIISEHQLVQHILFEMFAKVESARQLSRAAIAYNATPNPPSVEHSIASKVLCTRAAFEVSSDAIQIFGATGLTRGMLVEKFIRDARMSLIEDGVNELLGLVAGNHISKVYEID